jgi:hypothetical protein
MRQAAALLLVEQHDAVLAALVERAGRAGRHAAGFRQWLQMRGR